MKLPFRFVISLCLLGISLPAPAAVNAWLDQYQVSPGETVQLTLQHDGQTSSHPDLGPLQQDFQIIGRSTSSNVQIVNGKMSSQEQLNLTLVPKRDGKLQIPALQWDGQATPPLTLTVSSNAAGGQTGPSGTGNAQHVFIVTSLAQQPPYVQAAVKLTVRLYTDQPLYQASLDLPSSSDVMIKRVGQDQLGNEMRNGRNYQVIERHYLLFPQRSGPIRLDGPVLNAQLQDAGSSPFGSSPFFGSIFGRNPFAGMLSNTRPLRIQGDPIVLNALPRPAGSDARDWLPAQNVTLQETWQPDNAAIHAGDPFTLHLHLAATGQLASQLPDLSRLLQLPAGIRAYPDQARLDNGVQGDNVVGSRDQDIALIANQAGHYPIPALHLYWWDTAKNAQREIDLPERSLDVLPGAAAVSAGPVPLVRNPVAAAPPPASTAAPVINVTAPAADYRWRWTSLVLALLWLGTLAAWGLSRRAPAQLQSGRPATTPAPRLAEARNAFRQACRENDPVAARRHLLDWAKAAWPQDPPPGLRALASKLDDPAVELLLQQLDRACYASGEWHGAALLGALKMRTGRPVADDGTAPELAGLYS